MIFLDKTLFDAVSKCCCRVHYSLKVQLCFRQFHNYVLIFSENSRFEPLERRISQSTNFADRNFDEQRKETTGMTHFNLFTGDCRDEFSDLMLSGLLHETDHLRVIVVSDEHWLGCYGWLAAKVSSLISDITRSLARTCVQTPFNQMLRKTFVADPAPCNFLYWLKACLVLFQVKLIFIQCTSRNVQVIMISGPAYRIKTTIISCLGIEIRNFYR